MRHGNTFRQTTLLLGLVLAGGMALGQEDEPRTILTPGPTFRVPGIAGALSFSGNDTYLACTHRHPRDFRPEAISVFDLASEQIVWEWEYPALLGSSRGTLVAPTERELEGAPPCDAFYGGVTGVFSPANETRLAVMHDVPIWLTSPMRLTNGGANTIIPGMWSVGPFIHFYEGPGSEYEDTMELRAPQQLPKGRQRPAATPPAIMAWDFSEWLVAVVDNKGTLAVWSGPHQDPMGEVQAERGPLRSVDISPRGNLIATIGKSGIVRLWTARDLELVAELAGHIWEGSWVKFSPDGSRVVSMAEDKTLRVWDVKEGVEENSIHLPWLHHSRHLAMAGDGRSVYTFGWDQTARKPLLVQIDLDSGTITVLEELPRLQVTWLTCSTSGERLALGSDEGVILTWKVDLPLLAPEPPPDDTPETTGAFPEEEAPQP